MLPITVQPISLYDEAKEEFITLSKPVTLNLEHSLISISKWEAKYHRPYCDERHKKTVEEFLYYVKCMTINNKQVDPNAYYAITPDQMDEILDYIEDPHSATWFGDPTKREKSTGRPVMQEIVTSEKVYAWMISLKIPAEFEKWHFNRLLTLIEVCSEMNKPPKKMSKEELLAEYKRKNEYRRKKYNTKG